MCAPVRGIINHPIFIQREGTPRRVSFGHRPSPTIGFVLVRPGSWNRPADAASESIPFDGGSRAKRTPIAAFSHSTTRHRLRRAVGRIPARLFELLEGVICRNAFLILRINLNRVCGVVKEYVMVRWIFSWAGVSREYRLPPTGFRAGYRPCSK